MTPRQKEFVSMVLQAVAEAEGWDDVHPAVAVDSDGAWKVNAHHHPEPSRQLIIEVNKLLRERWAREKKARRRAELVKK